MIKKWILINIITHILLVSGWFATENKEIAASYTVGSLSAKMKWTFSDNFTTVDLLFIILNNQICEIKKLNWNACI